MSQPVFTPFTAQHALAVAIVVVFSTALSSWGRRLAPSSAARVGRLLGVVLVGYYLVESCVRVAFLGLRVADVMPFELCTALFFIGAFAYWAEHAVAFEIVYFWTFAGTIHSMLTPTPRAGFPDANYFQYFCAHGLLITSAVYAAVALRRVPREGSMLRAFLALQAFTLFDAIVDGVTGENYFYLRHKPPSPTLLDAFGPWPQYLLGGELVALVSFTLWNLPFVVQRRISSRRVVATGGAT